MKINRAHENGVLRPSRRIALHLREVATLVHNPALEVDDSNRFRKATHHALALVINFPQTSQFHDRCEWTRNIVEFSGTIHKLMELFDCNW
jgi:hypothetical protein